MGRAAQVQAPAPRDKDRSRERLHRATGISPIRVVHAGLFCDRFVSNDRAPHPCAAKMTVFLPNRLLRPSIAANSAGALGSAVAKRSEIGRASCRERGCQYVEISVVAVSSKKKKTKDQTT